MIEKYEKDFYVKYPIDNLIFHNLKDYRLLIGGKDFIINNFEDLKYSINIDNKTDIKKVYNDFVKKIYDNQSNNITFVNKYQDIENKYIFIDEVRKRIFIE